MKCGITTDEATQALFDDKSGGWSRAGARALVEYIEQQETDLGEIEFDAVAFRCEFSEYSSALDCVQYYDYTIDDDLDMCDPIEAEIAEEDAIDWLRERTTVIDFEGGIIIGDF